MTKSYEQLTQEIEALKAKAEAVRKKEAAGVASRIKEAIVVYGLTAEDLGFGGKESGGKGTSDKAASPKALNEKKAAKKTKSAVKYRDEAGNTWTGMGPKPGWLKAALAAGQALEALAVGAAGIEAAAVASDKTSAKTAKPTPKSKKSKKSKRPVGVAKYKDDAGHTWSGRGPKPGWVKDAIARGQSLDELAA